MEMALPKKWMFVNYATAWGKGLLFYFKNSIIVSAISILYRTFKEKSCGCSTGKHEGPFKSS